MQPNGEDAGLIDRTVPGEPEARALRLRAALLFTNFFLIIVALYQLKPASRSLFIESLGTARLPYVWIGTALVLGILISFYNRLVRRYNRFYVVLGSLGVFMTLMVLFRFWLVTGSQLAPAALLIFTDIFGVVLVEQFWSLTNSIYSTEHGKRWYGFVGTGGLLGGVLGGGLAAVLIKYTPLKTVDLVLVAAAALAVIMVLTWTMRRYGLYQEQKTGVTLGDARGGWRALLSSRYLLLITAIVLLAQMATPLVEYQFLTMVQHSYPHTEMRTAYLSLFFSVLGVVSIAVNLLVTPLVHRSLGVIAGLLVQPALLALSSWGFMMQPLLSLGAAMKICDRGLSYSINRASKELLYVPVDPVLTYQAKAWIDMFGYRLFKAVGSILILLLTQWLPVHVDVGRLSVVTLLICVAWIAAVLRIRQSYAQVSRLAQVPGGTAPANGG